MLSIAFHPAPNPHFKSLQPFDIVLLIIKKYQQKIEEGLTRMQYFMSKLN